MTRKIVSDNLNLSDSQIIVDNEEILTRRTIIASEIVQQYNDGYAYKQADELEKAAWTAEGRWVKILSHPQDGLITRASDINGKLSNVRFRKDLNDPKTNRPCRRGIEADVTWFKDRTPKEVLDKIRNGDLKDCSIGFTCEQDSTPGEFQGVHYDYVQRDICIDHLAAPIERGRCPSPYCGINMDAEPAPKIQVEDADLGVSYVFDASKYSKEQADEYVKKRQTADCPVCTRMLDVGLIEAANRLYKQYGSDVLEVIEGHPLPAKPEPNTDAASKQDTVNPVNQAIIKADSALRIFQAFQ